MKILLIDDEEPIRAMYGDKLVSEGYEVAFATNGAEAIEAAKEQVYDLILLDIIMPKVNGLDALTAIRHDSKNKQTPIFLLTNIPEDLNVKKAKQLGGTGYMFKADTEPSRLVQFLKKFLKDQLSDNHSTGRPN